MRDRPARFGLRPPFKRSGGVLVGPHNGGIDRHRPADVVDGIRCSEDSGENLLPRAVPTAHLISRLRAVWNEPSSSRRRSRQGELVRYSHAMASSVRRWSAHRRPGPGSAGISGAIRSHITSVILHRTDTSDQLTNPSKRHALAHTLLDAIPPTRSSERRRRGMEVGRDAAFWSARLGRAGASQKLCHRGAHESFEPCGLDHAAVEHGGDPQDGCVEDESDAFRVIPSNSPRC